MRQLIRLSLVFISLFIVAGYQPVYSQASRYTLSSRAQQELTSVQGLLGRNEFQAALEALNNLLPQSQNSKYDQAVTYQTLGYVYSSLNRFTEAAQAFSKALSSNALPAEISHEVEYNLARLLISEAKYQEGMQYLSNWFRSESNPSAEAHYLAATAYYFLDDFKQMVFQGRNALTKRQNAPATWYELLLAGYYEIDDMPAAAELLETMMERFPDRDQYWSQLAGIYLSIDQPGKALALMELAYLNGTLKNENELMQLVQTYLYLNMPYKAATLLGPEIQKGNIKETPERVKLLADSWFLAREVPEGIKVLESAIGRYDQPDLLYRLAQLYVEAEAWQKSVDTLNKVVTNRDYKEIADAWLLLGVAALQMDDRVISYRALNNALKFETTRDQARQWMAELRD